MAAVGATAGAASAVAAAARRSSVLVLGGGVSGLSSAYYLQKLHRGRERDDAQQVHLWEKSRHAGGWIRSTAGDHGAVYEVGPRSLRAVGPSGRAALLLADELRLHDDIVFASSSDVSAKNRFIYVNKKLVRLPNSLGGVLRRRDPFSRSLAYFGVAEMLKGRNSPASADESIYDFTSRRLGDEVARYLIDAMTRGIFAGDSRKLSVSACFPQLKTYEARAGSILRGALLPAAKSKPQAAPSGGAAAVEADGGSVPALIQRASAEKWAIWSLKNGLQTLTDRLHSTVVSLGANVSLETECTRLEFTQNGKVKAYSAAGAVLEADRVVSALYAPRLAELVAEQQPRLAALLRSVPAVSVAVVNLEYRMPRSAMPVQGFGHLVPSCEESAVLGIIYDSCVFPQHDRRDVETVRYTCMMGGAWMEQLFGKPSSLKASTFEAEAVRAVREQLGIAVDPSVVRVSVLQDCIPQYVLGHTALVRDIEECVAEQRLPLSLVGSSYKGVAVGDCIAGAAALASSL